MIQDLSGSWYIKGSDESKTRVDSPVPLKTMIQTDLGSLIVIQITPKELTLSYIFNKSGYTCTVEFRLYEIPRVTKIGFKNRIVREIVAKVTVFD